MFFSLNEFIINLLFPGQFNIDISNNNRNNLLYWLELVSFQMSSFNLVKNSNSALQIKKVGKEIKTITVRNVLDPLQK